MINLTEKLWLVKPLFTGIFFSLGIILFFQLLVRLVLQYSAAHQQNMDKVDFSVGRLKIISVVYFSVLASLFEYKSALSRSYAAFINFRMLLLIFIVVFLGFRSSFEIMSVDVLAHLFFYHFSIETLYHSLFMLLMLLLITLVAYLIRKRDSPAGWVIPAVQGLITMVWITLHYVNVVGIGKVTTSEMWFNIWSFLLMETILFFGLTILFRDNQQLISVTRQATIDTLTKLKNYNMFHKEYANVFARAQIDQNDLSMIEMDIDRFKGINDTYGHLAGNDVLTRVGATLREITDQIPDAECYRTGGEEFSILLPHKTVADAQVIAQDLHRQIAALTVNYNGQPITFTASIGIAKLRVADRTSDQLFERADRMLYLSKGRGRNLITTDETE